MLPHSKRTSSERTCFSDKKANFAHHLSSPCSSRSTEKATFRWFCLWKGENRGLVDPCPPLNLSKGGEGEAGEVARPTARAIVIALSGYLALVVITLTVQLVHPVRAFLEGLAVIQVPFPAVATARGFVTPAAMGRKLPLFRHAGAVLTYSSLVGYLFYRQAGWYRPGAARRIVSGTVQRVMSSSVGIASMVAMAMVMQHAGMTETLARGLAAAVGRAYPPVAAWVGALGAFMTGSNTNSNVVFAALQQRTADLLGYSAAVILAAQSSGGALASVFAPTKVVVGASTTGMAGREGDVMAALGKYILVLVTLVSVLTAGALALGLW